MIEARISEAIVLKRILDAIKDIVNDANFDCADDGISLQAMDNSHVSLVTLLLRAEGFESFRCDRNLSLGLNVQSLWKILRCAGNEDCVTLKANEDRDVLSLLFESARGDRTSEFDLKLMDIDAEHLGIPETEFDAVVKMSSNEFQRICKDLLVMGESVTISVNKEGVRFGANGDIGSGSVFIKQGSSAVDDKNGTPTTITLQQPVNLTFSLKYLNYFTKASPLSDSVTLSLADRIPGAIEYKIGDIGYIRFYLAPKIDDDEEGVEVKNE